MASQGTSSGHFFSSLSSARIAPLSSASARTTRIWELGDQVRQFSENCTRMISSAASRPRQNGAIAQRVNRTQFRAIWFRRSSVLQRGAPKDIPRQPSGPLTRCRKWGGGSKDLLGAAPLQCHEIPARSDCRNEHGAVFTGPFGVRSQPERGQPPIRPAHPPALPRATYARGGGVGFGPANSLTMPISSIARRIRWSSLIVDLDLLPVAPLLRMQPLHVEAHRLDL